MIMPTEKTPSPHKPGNTPTQEHKASAAAAFLTEKGRHLYALVRRRWLPTVGRACVRMLESAVADVLGQREHTYRKGEGYPEVRILGNGVIIVPSEELYGSTKAQENLEAMRKRMQAVMEGNGLEEVKQPAPKTKKATPTSKVSRTHRKQANKGRAA